MSAELPAPVQDYVVGHEPSHTVEKSHTRVLDPGRAAFAWMEASA